MKKLLIIALAMVGLSTYGATSNWKFNTGTGVLKAGYGDSSVLKGVEVYLLAAESKSQSDLLAGLRDGSITKADITGENGHITKGTTDNAGKIIVADGIEFSRTDAIAGNTYNYYGVVFATVGDDEFVFISATNGVAASDDPGKYQAVQIATTPSKNAYGDNDFSAAGWYTYSVPEPTSAMMLVLGLAGLALRRKQK